MPRPKMIVRPRKLTIALPEDVAAKLDMVLWSVVLNRVPQGAYQAFFVERINEYLSRAAGATPTTES